MQHDTEHPETSELCYLDASKVQSPAGVLSELEVVSVDGEPLGSIEGVVIDATTRSVRYFDIQAPGWFRRRRYLLEANQSALVEPDQKVLRLRTELNRQTLPEIDPHELRRFSDDDLLAAMFSRHAA